MEIISRYIVTIPDNIAVLYCQKKKLLTIIGFLSKKSLKIDFKLMFLNDWEIYISPIPFIHFSNAWVKKSKIHRGVIKSWIFHIYMETSATIFVKLKFVGVGYKAFSWEEFKKNSLLFKLGYSHFLYFRTINELKVTFLKHTWIFIYGASYQLVFQSAAVAQACRYPDPYKGKGILLETQKINLKQGKKV